MIIESRCILLMWSFVVTEDATNMSSVVCTVRSCVKTSISSWISAERDCVYCVRRLLLWIDAAVIIPFIGSFSLPSSAVAVYSRRNCTVTLWTLQVDIDSDVDCVQLFRLTLRLFDDVSTACVVIYFFNSDFKFFDDASEFSVTSLYIVFIFCSKFMLIFLQSVFYRD